MIRFLFLSLLSVSAWAEVPLLECWDGAKWTGGCPPRPTEMISGADIEDVSSSVTVSLDVSEGEVFYAAKNTLSPGICPTAPTLSEIKNGVNVAAHGVVTVTATGSLILPFTGLTANTEYCAWAYHEDAQGKPGGGYLVNAHIYIVGSAPWVTRSVSTPTGPAVDLREVDAFFVGTGGNNNNDCLTHETRCATTAGLSSKTKVNGRDVYILAGTDNGVRAFFITWEGGPANRVVVGCYYLDGNNSDQLTSCNEGSGANQQIKPLIRGTYEESCRQTIPSTCPIDTSGAVPSSIWGGLIQTYNRKYVTVQDLRVENSSGLGVLLGNDVDGPTFPIVQRVDIRRAFHSGIQINKAASGNRAIIRDNTILDTALSRVDGRTANWPPCVIVDSNTNAFANTLIERNRLHACGGEGFGMLRTRNNIIRENVISNVRRPAIYLDNSSGNVVEHNIIVGRGYISGMYNPAIDVEVEPYGGNNTYSSIGNVFRNNLFFNTQHGMRFDVSTTSNYNCSPTCINPAAEGYKVGGRFVGNTINLPNADGGQFFRIGNNALINNNISYISFMNNVAVGSMACEVPTLSTSLLLISHNAFSGTPTDSDCLGASYVIGSIGLTTDSASNGSNMPTAENARLPSNSSAIDAGAVLNSTILDVDNYPQFADIEGDLCFLSASDWEKELLVDYECVVRGANVTIGGLETLAQ
jgi:parallel beta-helix repeat protein